MGPEGINSIELHLSAVDKDGLLKEFKGITELPDTTSSLSIKKVIFNEPATIIFWDDGTKTVVKCKEGDLFTYEMGIYAATLKKIFGSTYSKYKKDVNNIIDKEIDKEEVSIIENLMRILNKCK